MIAKHKPSLACAALALTLVAPLRAETEDELATNRNPAPKRIVICMDGTWNSPAKKVKDDDGEERFKASNVLKTCRAVKALDDVTATLVFTGQPTDGETVTIDSVNYTFQEQLTEVDGHVQIGKDEVKSLQNLLYAINKKGHRGRYADSTPRHPSVVARTVRGNPRSIEIVSRPDCPYCDPFAVEEGLANGYWISKNEIATRMRKQGLDPRTGISQITYYDLGVGALHKFPGFANRIHRTVDKLFGGAAGAGFEGNIEDAYTFLSLNYREGDEVFLFGFSRGASSARGLSRFIDWMGGIPPPEDAYWIPEHFDAFIRGASFKSTRKALLEERERRRIAAGDEPEKAKEKAQETLGVIVPARVKFLGAWDTVLSLGGRRTKAFVGKSPAPAVDHARQAIAIDERRVAYRQRPWTQPAVEQRNQTLEQRWFAGAHSNVGGGYPQQDLSNIALRWMVNEARDAGLGFDWNYFWDRSRRGESEPYDGKLYNSNKAFWRFLHTITFRRGKGVRPVEVSETAGLTLHRSVLERLASSEVEYRPKNLLRYLASVPDLDTFLDTVPGLPDGFELPDDVLEAIEAER